MGPLFIPSDDTYLILDIGEFHRLIYSYDKSENQSLRLVTSMYIYSVSEFIIAILIMYILLMVNGLLIRILEDILLYIFQLMTFDDVNNLHS